MKVEVTNNNSKNEIPYTIQKDFAKNRCGMREPDIPEVIKKLRAEKEKKNGKGI